MVGISAAAESRRLLEEAVACHRNGELPMAEMLYREVLRLDARNGLALSLLAVIHFQAGDREGGLEQARQAAKLAPRDPSILNNLGNMLLETGAAADAESCYKRAVQAEPRFGDGWVNLGAVLFARGRFKEAVAAYQHVLAINPGYPGAHEHIAKHALEEGDIEQARRHAARLAEIDPNRDNRVIHLRVAQRLMEAGRFQDATDALMAPVRRIHALGADVRDFADTFDVTTQTKLLHDIEQMEYLRSRDLIPAAYERAIENYRAVLDLLPLTEAELPGHRHKLNPAERTRLGPSYNRLLHLPRLEALPGNTINPAIDGAEVERRLQAEPDWPVVIDDFLTPEALAAFQKFCLEATVWWQFTFAKELGASIRNGFASAPMLQVAQEARQRFPQAFGPHEPRVIWAYKYYENSSGLAAHVDDGAVSINLWITPDRANRDPGSGGLRFWNVPAPHGFFESKDVAEKTAILEQLLAREKPPMRRIPYRCNRALLFRSNLAHQTDSMDFIEGYENRRINLTFLFGDRRD